MQLVIQMINTRRSSAFRKGMPFVAWNIHKQGHLSLWFTNPRCFD